MRDNSEDNSFRSEPKFEQFLQMCPSSRQGILLLVIIIMLVVSAVDLTVGGGI